MSGEVPMDEVPRCSCGTALLRIDEDGDWRTCPHCDRTCTYDPSDCIPCRRLRKVKS